jgi:hypothetical protein
MSSAVRSSEDDPTSFSPLHTFEEYAGSTKDGRCRDYLSVVRAVTCLHGSMEEFSKESEQKAQEHGNNSEDY